jgi:acetyl esterase/lipase
MSIVFKPEQAASLSKGARDFLRATPTIRLPAFLYRYLARPANVPKMRAQFQAGEDKIEEQIINEHGLQLTRLTVSGIPVLVITPPKIAHGLEGFVVLNIHGGGFVMGTARDRTALLSAAEFGMPVWSIDYTLAPEARFPVAINECLAVYREMVQAHAANRIIGVSSSAGGQIMLAMLLRAHADGLPMPAALSMYTPASDISGVGDSSIANDGRDVVPLKLSLALMQQNYLNDDDATSPQVSPLYADYPVDFPPTVISTGTRDLLLSNCVRLFWKIKGAGVKSELLVLLRPGPAPS